MVKQKECTHIPQSGKNCAINCAIQNCGGWVKYRYLQRSQTQIKTVYTKEITLERIKILSLGLALRLNPLL